MVRKMEAASATAISLGPKGAVVIMDENFILELLQSEGYGTRVRSSLPSQRP